MKLYHGTSEPKALAILQSGVLKPRGANGHSNWKHSIESNPRAVYMTDAYAMHFAFSATDAEKEERWAILEIETDRLQPLLLAPDEDFLEQAGRGNDNLPVHWEMKARTRHYRKQAAMPHYQKAWEKSLQYMGTVAYYGAIPTSCITRISYFDPEKNNAMAMFCVQASICLANYALVGHQYKAMLRWMMGGEVEPEEIDNFLAMAVQGEKIPQEFMAQLEERRSHLQEMLADRSGLKIENVYPQ